MNIYNKLSLRWLHGIKLKHLPLQSVGSCTSAYRISRYNNHKAIDSIFSGLNVHLSLYTHNYCTHPKFTTSTTANISNSRPNSCDKGGIAVSYKQVVVNPQSLEEAKRTISQLVANEPRLLLIKGTPEAPMCGFSAQVLRVMEAKQLSYAFVDVLCNEYVRQGAKEVSNWPTFPQVFEEGEFVGGCDVVTEMYTNF